MTCKIERPIVIGDLKVRVDLLTDPAGQIMMILQNLEQRNIEVSITVPLNNIDSLTEQFSGEALMMSSLQDRSITTVALAPKEVKIYCGR